MGTKQLKLDPARREGRFTNGTLNESRSIREWENTDSPLEIRFYVARTWRAVQKAKRWKILTERHPDYRNRAHRIAREDNVISWLKQLQVPRAAGTYNHPVQTAVDLLPANFKKCMATDGLLKQLCDGEWPRGDKIMKGLQAGVAQASTIVNQRFEDERCRYERYHKSRQLVGMQKRGSRTCLSSQKHQRKTKRNDPNKRKSKTNRPNVAGPRRQAGRPPKCCVNPFQRRYGQVGRPRKSRPAAEQEIARLQAKVNDLETQVRQLQDYAR